MYLPIDHANGPSLHGLDLVVLNPSTGHTRQVSFNWLLPVRVIWYYMSLITNIQSTLQVARDWEWRLRALLSQNSTVSFLCFTVGKGWTYTNPATSVNHWSKLPNTMCSGYEQSPIDIDPADTIRLSERHRLTATLSASPTFDQGLMYTVVNNGHSGNIG